MSFLEPKIWDLVPNEVKDIGNLAAFKKAIKKWSPEKCPCRLCKDYISNVNEGRGRIFPVQKTLKCNRVSNIARK